MVFKNNIPQPTDNLSDSQNDLLNNNMQLDASFGVDHYAFSNLTANNGFHNQVTTPLIVGSAHPTTTTNPIFYAMKDSTNLGVLQYSRGPTNAVPTPLTCLHGGPTALAFGFPAINLFDFTGITICLGTVHAGVDGAGGSAIATPFYWNGTNFFFPFQPVSGSNAYVISLTSTGSVLQMFRSIPGPTTNAYWTIQFSRLQ